MPLETPKPLAILRVSRDLLVHVLRLPEGTRILDISPHVYFDQDIVTFKVEHPEFPLTYSGMTLPVCNPQYGKNPKTGETEFLGWGL
jgi:hypothetical protein